MTNFFVADTHFGHSKILEFCPYSRLCSTIEEHDERIIDNWNAEVKPNDTVYILGDVSWHGPEKTKEILRRLNGHKNLILGNHDHQFLQEGQFKNFLEDVRHYREIKINKIDVIMFHYPILEWNKAHYGSVMLHGHTHGALVMPGKSVDVGIDGPLSSGMRVVAWDNIIEYVKDRPVTQHHNRTLPK